MYFFCLTENITNSLILEGLVSVREAVLNSKDGNELKTLDAAAKAAKKGKWDPNVDPQVFLYHIFSVMNFYVKFLVL